MKSPFKFLDSFTKDDREIFFGRDREIEELYQKVFDSKLLLVYGVSGTGKSSLIHCGLANKFHDTDWLPLVVRRAGNINESIASAIKNASITPQQNKFSSSVDFKKGVKSLYLDHYKPVFFIFDQFEELFIFGDKDERREFIHIVKSLIESDLQCRLIFVMREEYMAWVTEFEKFIPTFFSNRVRIEKMSHRNALEAIKEPCKVFNITLEEGFAEALLEKLSPGTADIELTYLQVFLDKIFRIATTDNEVESRDPQITLSLSHLNYIGNVSDLLGSFLDDQIALMTDPEAALTVLKAFVSGKGTKRPASEEETIENVISLGKEISNESVTEFIQTFVKLRLLRDKDDHGRYELRHDSLAEKIFEKFSIAEKELLEIKQMIENAFQYFLKRNLLLNNDDLTFIASKDSLLNLGPELKKFMDDSRRHQKEKQRVFKRLIVISAFAFILLLSTIIYSIVRRTRISDSSKLAKESMTQFNRPVDRLCLAEAAWKDHNGDEAREALLKAFNNSLRNPDNDSNFLKLQKEYLIKCRPVSSIIEFAQCSADNRFIYGYTCDSVFIWNRNGTLNSRFSHGIYPVISMLMSFDGETIGAVNTDSILTVWDNKENLKFTHKTRYNRINKDQIFRFTKDNRIIVISADKDADLLNLKGDIIQSFNLHKGEVNAVDFSDDGKFIATASSDSKINIWYQNSEKNQYDLYNTLAGNNDTVYCVDFAKNSRYVLSVSSDGRILVTSINGNLVYEKNSKDEVFTDNTLGKPFFSAFDQSGTGIIFKTYKSNKNYNDYFMTAIYTGTEYYIAISGQDAKFDYIGFSPMKKYLVYISGNDVSLISRSISIPTAKVLFNSYRLMQINGQKPFFTPDDQYIFTICGNTLESWFIDIDTINRIADGFYQKWIRYEY